MRRNTCGSSWASSSTPAAAAAQRRTAAARELREEEQRGVVRSRIPGRISWAASVGCGRSSRLWGSGPACPATAKPPSSSSSSSTPSTKLTRQLPPRLLTRKLQRRARKRLVLVPGWWRRLAWRRWPATWTACARRARCVRRLSLPPTSRRSVRRAASRRTTRRRRRRPPPPLLTPRSTRPSTPTRRRRRRWQRLQRRRWRRLPPGLPWISCHWLRSCAGSWTQVAAAPSSSTPCQRIAPTCAAHSSWRSTRPVRRRRRRRLAAPRLRRRWVLSRPRWRRWCRCCACWLCYR
mmetsp:Transcript_24139/g.59243  ORF Transcript_24139/g.59243 Transcript_24139/m.59243 type:complete len:292 (+) Transcript_24139:1633-2508(+)